MIQFLNSGKVELYNLEADLGEKNNLVEQEIDVYLELTNELITWRKANNVALPLASMLEYYN